MSEFVLDASLTLQWFLEDEVDLDYALSTLAGLSTMSAVVPTFWFYEVGNGLVMAKRRKRISLDQIDGFLIRLQALPIAAGSESPSELLELPAIAHRFGLTNYDAAYLALAERLHVPLATTDAALRRAAVADGVEIVFP